MWSEPASTATALMVVDPTSTPTRNPVVISRSSREPAPERPRASFDRLYATQNWRRRRQRRNRAVRGTTDCATQGAGPHTNEFPRAAPPRAADNGRIPHVLLPWPQSAPSARG